MRSIKSFASFPIPLLSSSSSSSPLPSSSSSLEAADQSSSVEKRVETMLADLEKRVQSFHLTHDDGVDDNSTLYADSRKQPRVMGIPLHPMISGQPHGDSSVNKRSQPSFEDMVSAEMAKGCTQEVAAQRVVNAHGYKALAKRTNFAKGVQSVQDTFHDAAAEIYQNEGLSGCELARWIRAPCPPSTGHHALDMAFLTTPWWVRGPKGSPHLPYKRTNSPNRPSCSPL